MSRRFLWTVWVLYLSSVALITLTPTTSGGSGPFAALLHWLAASPQLLWLLEPVMEFSANVVMFLPWGVLGVVLTRRPWWVVSAGGFVVTVVIELLQHLVPGRVSDVRDVVANTFGGLLGAVLTVLVTRSALPRQSERSPAVVSSAADPS